MRRAGPGGSHAPAATPVRAWHIGTCGILRVGLLLLGGLLGAVSVARHAQAAPVVYGLDPSRSTLVVQLFKAGIGAAFAHDHVVRASRFAGQIQGDPADPTTATITLTVEATALQADEPAVRSQYGLTQALDEQDRQAIQAAMTGPGQLDVTPPLHPPLRRTTKVSGQNACRTVLASLTGGGAVRTTVARELLSL